MSFHISLLCYKRFAKLLSDINLLCVCRNFSFLLNSLLSYQICSKPLLCPFQKLTRQNVTKLRPVSLSDCFAKVAETFITDWILEDISDKFDLQQYGNVKGVSTSHFLVSLLHFLHQGADKVNNVGTEVLTDFSKAFNMVDHNLLIEKFIHIGVRRSIVVPWLCDFLSNRMLDTILLFLILQLYLPVYHKAPN